MIPSLKLIVTLLLVIVVQFVQAQNTPLMTCMVARFKDRNLDLLANRTLEAAGITSKNAGKYLTVEQVVNMTSQPPAVWQPIYDWLNTQKVLKVFVPPFKDWIFACVYGNVTLPVGLEKYLNQTTWSHKSKPMPLPTNKAALTKRTSHAKNIERGQSKLKWPWNAPPYDYPQVCSFNSNPGWFPVINFPQGSNFVSPGVYSISQMLKDANTQAHFLALVPCDYKNGTVLYSKGNCNFNVINSFNTILPSQKIPYVQNPAQTLVTPSSQLKTVKCGDVAKKSGLGINACVQINNLLLNLGVKNDIGNNTLVYIVNQTAIAGFPKNVMVNNWNLTIQGTSGYFKNQVYIDSCVYRGSAQGSWITTGPEWLAQRYNFFQTQVSQNYTGKRVSAMLYLPDDYEYLPTDLALALNSTIGKNYTFSIPPTNGNPFLGSILNTSACWVNFTIYGTSTVGENCGEPSLDTQVLAEIGGSPFTDLYFSPAPSGFMQTIVDDTAIWLLALGSVQPVPTFLSMSFGDPFHNGSNVTQNLYNLTSSTFLKLAAVGVTMITSSGDEGAAGNGFTGGCVKGVAVAIPAALPWVTTLGATQWANVNGKLQEIACVAPLGGGITSGGGFSPFDKRPVWQKDVVDSYLAKYSNSTGFPNNKTQFFAPQGRAYPDLAWPGSYTPIVSGGIASSTAGTSVSAPSFTGFMTQITLRLRQVPGWQNETLGFINPFLYWAAKNYPKAFNDITLGNNIYTGQHPPYTNNKICDFGYPSTPGWDAVTGLGSPNQIELFNAAKTYIKLQRQARGLKN